jgi:hypothetical protein
VFAFDVKLDVYSFEIRNLKRSFESLISIIFSILILNLSFKFILI